MTQHAASITPDDDIVPVTPEMTAIDLLNSPSMRHALQSFEIRKRKALNECILQSLQDQYSNVNHVDVRISLSTFRPITTLISALKQRLLVMDSERRGAFFFILNMHSKDPIDLNNIDELDVLLLSQLMCVTCKISSGRIRFIGKALCFLNKYQGDNTSSSSSSSSINALPFSLVETVRRLSLSQGRFVKNTLTNLAAECKVVVSSADGFVEEKTKLARDFEYYIANNAEDERKSQSVNAGGTARGVTAYAKKVPQEREKTLTIDVNTYSSKEQGIRNSEAGAYFKVAQMLDIGASRRGIKIYKMGRIGGDSDSGKKTERKSQSVNEKTSKTKGSRKRSAASSSSSSSTTSSSTTSSSSSSSSSNQEKQQQQQQRQQQKRRKENHEIESMQRIQAMKRKATNGSDGSGGGSRKKRSKKGER